MRSVRRPVVAVAASSALLLAQAAADPTGVLALVGWPGGRPQADLWWPLARYVVFVPVMLLMVGWSAVRAGGRYWTMSAGVVLAAVLAQSATCLAMTGDLAVSAWGGGYVTATAVPTALVVAGVVRLADRRRDPSVLAADTPPPAPISRWAGAVVLGTTAPLLAGSWWTGAAYAPGIPTPHAGDGATGVVGVVVAMAMLAGAGWLGLRWSHRRVPGLLGTWLGALVAGGLFGLAQSVVGLVVDGGFRGDLWPLLAGYVHVADGLSYGACTGWLVGAVVLASDRVLANRTAGLARTGIATVAVGAVAATAAALLASPPAPATARNEASVPAGFLRVENGRITDGSGNQVLLRGVNVNQLVDFYQARADVPVTRELTEDDYTAMASYGFDVVRLGLSWSALEPERGSLDPAYVGRIRQAVAWGKAHGIRTVLDMHQDGWSNAPTAKGTRCRPGTEPMWGYDGAPGWATHFDGAPRCSFTGRDISPAGDRAFEHFWFDTDGIRTALARTWGELAAQFADEEAVAGYDLINEPGFGETPPVTTSTKQGEFYATAIDAIRDAGAPQIVFVEPSILWSGVGVDSGPAIGFTDDLNVAFSPHLYAESITMDASLGLPPIVSTERQFELAQRVADQHGMPLWSGEYGYWGDEESIAGHIGRYATEEDQRILGSAYWVWKQACGDPQNGIGELGLALVPQDCTTGGDAPRNEQLLGVLSRAYPQAAPGRLTSLEAGVSGKAEDSATLSLTGTAEARTCGLRVWVPGPTDPVVKPKGLTDLTAEQVPGGWVLTACADGDYRLDVTPSEG